MITWSTFIVGAIVWTLLASWVALVLFWLDKRAAKREGAQRIPERTLHVWSALGGWPGSLLGRRWFRHKTQKQPFVTVLWGTILVNLVAWAALVWANLSQF
jgi:uncharacterized membrane protein YsdA (DUF1294 family)